MATWEIALGALDQMENVSFLQFPEKDHENTKLSHPVCLDTTAGLVSNKYRGRNVISAPNKIIKIPFRGGVSLELNRS